MRSSGVVALAVAVGGWVAGADRGVAPSPVASAGIVDEAPTTIDCNDDDPCTIDLADPAIGCRWIPSADECISGDASVRLAASEPADAHSPPCDADVVDLPGHTVVAGPRHSLAVDDAGRLFAWGDNGEGQLGTGAIGGHRHRPHAIGRGYRDDPHALAAGPHHSLAIRTDGTVAMWGRDDVGEAAVIGAAIPRIVVFANGKPLRDVTAVAAGRDVSFALASDGTVWSWGTSGPGRLGDGTRGATHRVSPVQVMLGPGHPLTDVVAIEAASDHASALTSSGDVVAWGGVVDGRVRVYATPMTDPLVATRLASR